MTGSPWTIKPCDIFKAHARLSKSDKQRFAKLRTVLDMPDRDISALGLDTTNPDIMTLLRYNSNMNGQQDVMGVHDLCCRFNHSCYRPNAEKRPIEGTSMVMECWTTSEIQEGEEINACYQDELFHMTTDERKKNFPLMAHFFACECRLCSLPPTALEHFISDMRRCLLRDLVIALYGRDICRAHQAGRCAYYPRSV